MHCLTRSVIKLHLSIAGLILFAATLGYLLASSYQPYPPDAQLRSYLEHCHNAQMGPDEGAAFAKVFNGQERRFAGDAFRLFAGEDFDQLIVTVDDLWFYLFTLPNEYLQTDFDPYHIEFDCKIKEFNVGYSLRYYENALQRRLP